MPKHITRILHIKPMVIRLENHSNYKLLFLLSRFFCSFWSEPECLLLLPLFHHVPCVISFFFAEKRYFINFKSKNIPIWYFGCKAVFCCCIFWNIIEFIKFCVSCRYTTFAKTLPRATRWLIEFVANDRRKRKECDLFFSKQSIKCGLFFFLSLKLKWKSADEPYQTAQHIGWSHICPNMREHKTIEMMLHAIESIIDCSLSAV